MRGTADTTASAHVDAVRRHPAAARRHLPAARRLAAAARQVRAPARVRCPSCSYTFGVMQCFGHSPSPLGGVQLWSAATSAPAVPPAAPSSPPALCALLPVARPPHPPRLHVLAGDSVYVRQRNHESAVRLLLY